MRPTLLFFPAIFSLIVSCKKEKTGPLAETPVQKQVAYYIFAAKDYSAPVFQNVKIDLRLQVRIIDYKTGEMKLVWDSTFGTRRVTEFPSYNNLMVIHKSFPVMDSHEKLNGAYSVRYDMDGAIKQEGFSDEVVPGKTSVLIEAGL